MSSNSGYSKLYRDFLDSDLWLAEPFTKGQAWVDLFSLANHKERTIWIRGVKLDVRRGELARSELSLAQRWQWSRGKVRRFLDWLEIDKKIEHQKNNVTSLIYIINYDRYNSNDTPNSTTDGHQTVQQTDTKRYTDKNDKHYKNEKNKEKINKKEKSTPAELKSYLEAQVASLPLSVFRDKILDFFDYRKSIRKAPYTTILAVNGLIRDLNGCLSLGMDLNFCLDRAMEKNWLTPDPKYFESKTGGKINGSSKVNFTGNDTRPSVWDCKTPDWAKDLE